MHDHVYKKIDVVGSSPDSLDDAIRQAVKRASKSMRNLEWFEIDNIRGHITGSEVAHFQVTLKLGFRLDD